MQSKTIYSVRKFLNIKKTLSACIQAYIHRRVYNDGNIYIDGDISITDCNTKITLDFDYGTDSKVINKKNIIAKLDRLSSVINEFKLKMESEILLAEKLKKEYKDSKNKSKKIKEVEF